MKKIELEKQLESYYEDCEFRKRLNEKTIKAYTIDLNQYLEFITTTEINQKIINEYIHYLNKKYLKYKTIKRKIASVKAFYSYLEYEEIIDYSPFNKIKTKIKPAIIIILTILSKVFNDLTNKWLNIPDDLKFKNFYPDIIFFLIRYIKLAVIFIFLYYLYLKLRDKFIESSK